MMKNKFAVFAAALMLAAVTASCGHDESGDSSAPDLPILAVEATEAETTEASTEETTTVETEQTTEKSTEAATEKTTKKDDKTQPTKAAEKDNDNNGSSEPDSEPEPDPEPTPDPVPDDTPQEPAQEIKFGFDKLDSNAGDVISVLGDPVDVTSAPACFANGADSKIYTYENIVVECYVLGGEEKICTITITGGNYSTNEGIKIGSSQADVEAVYGAGDQAGEYVLYFDGDKELDVKYDNGSVCELMFYMSV